jgi:hypothetical protein
MPERFNFSCTVTLPDASPADVQQRDVLRGARQDMTFFVAVRLDAQKTFPGALHLSGSSLSHLDDCPGDTRADKSMRVADALRAWVKEHGLSPEFKLEVTVGHVTGHPCGVSIAPSTRACSPGFRTDQR